MTTQDDQTAHLERNVAKAILGGKPVEVERHPEGFGRILVTVGTMSGANFEVRVPFDGGERRIYESAHQEKATHVLEALDGTERPWHSIWMPRGFNTSENEDKKQRIFAVGSTVDDCIAGFADSLGFTKDQIADVVHDADPNPKPGTWMSRASFDGTGMKMAGLVVPGGFLMNWWA